MAINIENVTWSVQGEPYQVPCLRLTVNGIPATIGYEQKLAFKSRGFLHVVFIPHPTENPLPDITLRPDRKRGFPGITLKSFIYSPRLVRYLDDLIEADDAGTFEDGRLITRGFEASLPPA